MLTARDLRGVYAIIPTPTKPGAERLDATDTVDLEETARAVEDLLAQGISGLIALGTTGECATLSNPDYDKFVACVLETVRKRVPTFIGASALGGHESVRRLRLVRELGGDGTLLGLPQWQVCTNEMALKFYAGIAEIFPEIAIMVYANQRAFRFDFNDDFWRDVARTVPSVMSAKFSNPKRLLDALKASEGKIHFLPNETAVLRFMELSPETTTACWATAASMGPEPVMAIMKAALAGDKTRLAEINKDIAWASEPIMPLVENPAEFASYNIQVEKLRIDAAGYCKAGPIRPPYDVMPEKWAEASRECGRRWAQIRPKYAAG
jgi:trans-o-hydroxybenzylidenepyruvate hydratase-aldolase